MRYSVLFPKSRKIEFKEDLSVNAKLLTKAGFIDQLMAGSYTLLPLGFRVIQKINGIIREELNKTGAIELSMPLLHPKEIWNETGRWDSAKDIMYQFEKDDKEYGLSFTHEEVVLDLARKMTQTYRDYPIKIYQFSTKFRNEPRAKSGILRGREFLMKDLYSLHTSEEDLEKYYWEVAEAYLRIFKRMGLDAQITEAAGGVFVEGNTHEFQVPAEVGEDTIYFSKKWKYPKNKEIMTDEDFKEPDLREVSSIEVGNIFPLGIEKYAKKMNVTFTDKDGSKQFPWFASYGIGPTRVMGTLAEVYHDDRGLMWPKSVAPYEACLITINNSQLTIDKLGQQAYERLEKAGIEVLYDDRDVSAGEKFASADLLGLPYRLVMSEKTRSASSGQVGDKIELKKRDSQETELLSLEEVISKIGGEKEF